MFRVTLVSIILVVPANHPAKNLKEWVAWAKAQNRPINGAVSTRGASVDITMQAFMQNMQDGFDMYGKLIKELNLKLE